MGADEVILPMVTEYMNIWFIGLPLFALPMVAMSMLRALGNARIPGALMTAGAAIQVLVAPALIFGVPGIHDGIGYTGSAWAFVASRFLTLLATAYVLTRRGMIRPLGDWRGVLHSWGEVLRIGVPSIMTNLVGPVSMGVVFGLLRQIRPRGGGGIRRGGTHRIARGDDPDGDVVEHLADGRPELGRGSAAIASTTRCGSATASRSRGVCSSLRCSRCSVAASSGLINNDPAVIEATYHYLLIVPLTYSTMGVSMVSGSCFVALGKPLPSLMLTITRMVLIYVPLAMLGDRLFGYLGIFGAGAVANVVVAGASYVWVMRMLQSERASRAPVAEGQAAAH